MLVPWPRAAHGYSTFLFLFYFVDFDTHFLRPTQKQLGEVSRKLFESGGWHNYDLFAPPGETGGYWAVCWLFSVLRGGKKMKSLLGLPWTLISGAFFLFVVCVDFWRDERVGRCLPNVHARITWLAAGWWVLCDSRRK